MNELELQKLIKKISIEYFNRPFLHKVKINNRMTTTGGRYFLKNHNIDINGHFLVPEYRLELIGIIKHELTHYHLHLQGLGYQHKDKDFKILLARVGGSRWTPDIGLKRKANIKYFYGCKDCHLIYPRVKKIDLRRFRCGRCHGHLALIEKR